MMKKALILIILTVLIVLTAFGKTETKSSTVTIGGFDNEISWETFKRYKDPAMIISDEKLLELAADSQQVATNSIKGIENEMIAQAHGALLYSEGKENPDVWDLVSLNGDGTFEFFKNTWKEYGGLSWQSMGTYNPHILGYNRYGRIVYDHNVKNFDGYGTGIVGDFDGDKALDYFGISESANNTDYYTYMSYEKRKYGIALYVTNILNVEKIDGKRIEGRKKYYKSVSENSGTFQNKEEKKPVNGTVGWVSTGIGKYDMNKDGYLDLIYSVRGSIFLIENRVGQFIGCDELYNHVLLDDDVLNNDMPIGGNSQGAAVCDVFDFNKDDIPDIIAGHTDKKGLYVYLGKEDEASDYPKYVPGEKIAIIGSDGKLTENATGHLINGGEEQLSISLLRVDEDGIVYICTDDHRQKNPGDVDGNGGKIMMLTLDPDLSTVENPYFICEAILDEKKHDFDHGSLGKFYPNGKDQLVIADGNHTEHFYVTKTEYKDYYKRSGKMLSIPLTDMSTLTDSLNEKELFIRKVDMKITISDEFFKTTEEEKPKATLFVNVFPERQRKNTGIHYYDNLYHEAYKVPIEKIEKIDGKYVASLSFEFDPVPYPVVSLAFKTNEGIPEPEFTPKIFDLEIAVQTGQPSLKITNISW